MSNLRSARVSLDGVLDGYSASYNAALVCPHTFFHSVSCNDVLRRQLLNSKYSPPFPFPRGRPPHLLLWRMQPVALLALPTLLSAHITKAGVIASTLGLLVIP